MTGVQPCALPIYRARLRAAKGELRAGERHAEFGDLAADDAAQRRDERQLDGLAGEHRDLRPVVAVVLVLGVLVDLLLGWMGRVMFPWAKRDE